MSFADAVVIFAGPVLVVEETRRDYGEQRASTATKSPSAMIRKAPSS